MAMSDTNMNTYMVTVKAEAGSEMAMQEVTVMVTDVDEAGTVTLSMPHPVVDTELTATLSDLDGMVSGEMWQWQKSMDMSSWMDITGATTMSYTPMTADVGYYLRATVMYTDGHGSNKEAMATTTSMVTEVPVVDPLVAKYDTDPQDGMIDRSEVLRAVNDYLFGEGDDAISRAEVLTLINLYLFPNG
jgi:hypothetical protein